MNKIDKNIPLKNYTTFKIGGNARFFLKAENLEDLIYGINFSEQSKIPFFILGNGSNLLISDKGFNGIVIKISNKETIFKENKIIVDAGVPLPLLIASSFKNGLSGLEWAAGIPGSIGGAIRGNAGAFGSFMADIIKEVEVFDLSIPKHEKFLCNNIFVHNTRELNLPRQNWLPTVARTGISTTGVGEINMFRLLKNSFRQNPDYVIVGEVRGKEAYVLFQGMASGHASISTMHANSVDSVIRRLETPPINLNASLVNSLDAVAIMSRVIVKGKESRKLTDIVEVVDVNDDGVALTNTPFVWNPADDKFYFKKGSKVFEKIEKKHGISKEELEKEFEMRTKLIYELFRRKIFGFDEIEKIVNDYYRNPEEILVKFGLSKLNK